MKTNLTLVVAVWVCVFTIVESFPAEKQIAEADAHVIGGFSRVSRETPYVAELRLKKNDKIVRHCGAARLNKQWFLTAAECLDQTKYDFIRITYWGHIYPKVDYDFHDSDMLQLKYKIHPQYNPESKANNIALILCDYCTPTDIERLADLPMKNVSGALSFKNVFVSSWAMYENSTKKDVINHLDAVVLHPVICNLLHFFRMSVDNLLCTTGTADKGISETDVGAPLVLRNGGNGTSATLIGIATSYKAPSIFSRPMIFTELYPYMEWIYRETNISPVE